MCRPALRRRIGRRPEERRIILKKVVSTEHAPKAIGPYSQAVEAGGLVIVSGQLPIDPATGAFPEGIEAQTRQSLTNAKAILAAAGLGMENVVKTTVFPRT